MSIQENVYNVMTVNYKGQDDPLIEQNYNDADVIFIHNITDANQSSSKALCKKLSETHDFASSKTGNTDQSTASCILYSRNRFGTSETATYVHDDQSISVVGVDSQNCRTTELFIGQSNLQNSALQKKPNIGVRIQSVQESVKLKTGVFSTTSMAGEKLLGVSVVDLEKERSEKRSKKIKAAICVLFLLAMIALGVTLGLKR